MFEKKIIEFILPQLDPALEQIEEELLSDIKENQQKNKQGTFVYLITEKDNKVIIIPAVIDNKGNINSMPKAKYLSDLLKSLTKKIKQWK